MHTRERPPSVPPPAPRPEEAVYPFLDSLAAAAVREDRDFGEWPDLRTCPSPGCPERRTLHSPTIDGSPTVWAECPVHGRFDWPAGDD